LPMSDSLSDLPLSDRLQYALAGGDDYELAFTADPSNRHAIEALSERFKRSHGFELTLIGRMQEGAGVNFVNEDGRPVALNLKAYEHF
jgi:thiamine-monophosphate kinase